MRGSDSRSPPQAMRYGQWGSLSELFIYLSISPTVHARKYLGCLLRSHTAVLVTSPP
jgi:hypothetical protein